ncbi:hypothetical protein BKA83DRAFT_4068841, partial [Pisolithus microcarpus]
LPLSALHNKEFKNIYLASINMFNKIQTQVFQALYTSDKNVFIGAPTSSRKMVCAKFTLLRLWSKRDGSHAVCIEPYQEMIDQHEWRHRFSGVQGGKEIGLYGGIVGDVLSCRWWQRKNVQTVTLLIAGEIQLIRGEVGPTYKVVILWTWYVSAQTEITSAKQPLY